MENTELEKKLFGLRGSVNETGTSAIVGVFGTLHCLTDTVFTLLTDELASGDSLVGVTLPAGTLLEGRFSAFTLTSGAVRAYRSVR
ncbi:MAG: hypothetical protein WCO57_04630 [Verrucomicrobiota bacterium]